MKSPLPTNTKKAVNIDFGIFFSCPLCGEKFTNDASLTKHLNEHEK